MLPEVVSSIESQLDERRGIARAQITSARPLDAEQQAMVQAALAKMTGKQVLGQYSVDESLLGGVTARVGSRVYDGSVRGPRHRRAGTPKEEALPSVVHSARPRRTVPAVDRHRRIES